MLLKDLRKPSQLNPIQAFPMKLKTLLIVATVFLLAACATVYTSQDFSKYQSRHQTVAILPFRVSIELKKLPDGVTSDQLRRAEVDEAYVFQKQLYNQLLVQYAKNRYTVAFQDVDKTNVLLERAGIKYENLSSSTKDEIAKILGVDAVISGQIRRGKPMSTGAAIVSTIFIGFSSTNKVIVNMAIHDGASAQLVWSYDHEVSGGLGSSAEGLAKSLMSSISKKFPYNKKNIK